MTFYCCQSVESIVVDKNNKRYNSQNNCNAIIDSLTNDFYMVVIILLFQMGLEVYIEMLLLIVKDNKHKDSIKCDKYWRRSICWM